MPKDQINISFSKPNEYKIVIDKYKKYVKSCKGRPLVLTAWARDMLLK